MFRKHFRFRRRLVAGLAFAALVVPATAQATTGVFVDGGPAPVSVPATSENTSYFRYHEVGYPVGTGPEVRSENAQRTATVTGLQADALRWTAMAQAYAQPSAAVSERSYGVPGPDPSLVPQVITSTSTGFDWRDAGIGASSAFGIALLLVLAVALVRRNQHTGLTSA
jgi:hypothetical protein